ncbi:molybdenum cofactor guanylyltransferase [Tautonia plasticadhaerens]|uniref:Probable molybdenum cofactor guanylyltransferase n=1 Tax=Tautonia plasticadhaerens TaxID=2527974 RepID=A0A518HAC8_9BACT|nr:molybdenum cofactor guanylyltransferase [Tautonia plasticadhaerens]QDV37811.1 putative molybdenum cofactor guanylyltransferase [Tautonia plasticadhaerens]
MEQLGAIVLCGGMSRRMGRPKEWLTIGGETFVGRVVRLASTRASIVVVSAAPGQDLPPLPPGVEVVRDPVPDLGPLRGIASGLGALVGRVEWAFAAAADAPMLEPRWIDRLRELASVEFDLVLPHVDGREHPLAALYRPEAAAPAALALLDSGASRLGLLPRSLRTRVVVAEELAGVDPRFQTLRNVNRPEDYDALLGPS